MILVAQVWNKNISIFYFKEPLNLCYVWFAEQSQKRIILSPDSKKGNLDDTSNLLKEIYKLKIIDKQISDKEVLLYEEISMNDANTILKHCTPTDMNVRNGF